MIVLMTGTTGLMGSLAAVAMLRAGHRVVTVGRVKSGLSAEKRVRKVLQSYPGYREHQYSLSSLTVLEGDILRPSCGLNPESLSMLENQVDVVLHCAAEVSFGTARHEESLRVNVEGVRHIAELAGKVKCRRIIHVSTAYVDQALSGAPSRTEYETSKLDGEHSLTRAAGRLGLTVQIVRPSILTGDREYGFTPTYNGIYPFLRYAATYVRELREVKPSHWFPHSLFYEGKVNLVPADYVASILLALAENPPGEDQVFNVINHSPWKVWDLIKILAEYYGWSVEDITNSDARCVTLPKQAQHMAETLIETYEPYFDTGSSLDIGSTNRIAQSSGIGPLENSPEWIFSLYKWGLTRNWQDIS